MLRAQPYSGNGSVHHQMKADCMQAFSVISMGSPWAARRLRFVDTQRQVILTSTTRRSAIGPIAMTSRAGRQAFPSATQRSRP